MERELVDMVRNHVNESDGGDMKPLYRNLETAIWVISLTTKKSGPFSFLVAESFTFWELLAINMLTH